MLHGESCPAHTYTLDLGHTSTLRFHFWLVALSPSTSGSSAELLTCNSRTITLLQVTAISGFLTGLSASTSASPFSLVSTQKPEWFFYCELSNHVLLNSMFFCLRVKSKSFQWLFRYHGVSLPMRTRGAWTPCISSNTQSTLLSEDTFHLHWRLLLPSFRLCNPSPSYLPI